MKDGVNLDVVFHGSIAVDVWVPNYIIDMNESVSFYEFQSFIEDYINNPEDSNLNFSNIYLGQSTII
mgnify:CR=1 FL=1